MNQITSTLPTVDPNGTDRLMARDKSILVNRSVEDRLVIAITGWQLAIHEMERASEVIQRQSLALAEKDAEIERLKSELAKHEGSFW